MGGKRRTLFFRVVLILSACAVIWLIFVLKDVIPLLKDVIPWSSVANWVVGGVIASILANLIWSFFYKSEVAGMQEALDRLVICSKQQIAAVSNAFDRKFFAGLFKLSPSVSHRIADVLGAQTEAAFRRYEGRVAVTEAQDKYVLVQPKIVSVSVAGQKGSSQEAPVWEMTFRCHWKWINDSGEQQKTPLKDFMLLVLGHPETAKSIAHADAARRYLAGLSSNVVKNTLVHPVDRRVRLTDSDVDQLFDIEEVTITHGDEIVQVAKMELKRVEGSDLNELAYRGFQLPARYQKLAIGKDETLTVEYSGRILVPRVGGAGSIEYSPSDVILDLYRVSLHVQPNDVDIVHDDSGCWYENVRLVEATSSGSKAEVVIEVVGERLPLLPDRHLVSIAWRARGRGATVHDGV